MDYTEIKRIVNNYDQFSIHFCYRTQDNEYITLAPNISGEVKGKIIDIINDNITSYENKNHVPYNQIGALDDTVESCKVDDFPIVRNLNSAVDQAHDGDLKPEDIEFLLYEVSLGTSRVFFLRRHNRLRTFMNGACHMSL